jgi:RND superfamily putative drug exporter
MRRPVPYLVGVGAVLLLLASPALRVEFGGFDERELPEGTPSRVVSERIADRFPQADTDPITVLVSGATPAQAEAFAAGVARLPEVEGAAVTAQSGVSTVISAGYPGEPISGQARDAVRAVRGLPAPEGAEVLVGGRTAYNVDMVASLLAGLPWMLLLMASAVMIVLFLAFGSVVLPVKAVLMNLLSIGAALGVVVWGFQDGNLAELLGFTSTGFVDPGVVLLMLAVLFGISTDYEVFLLSRVREEWDSTGDNTSSVAYGLQHTGRIITAAALLLIVVIGGFAAGEMAFVKLLGIGMIVAIAVDATLIRVLLVPATMRVLGRWNWWAPGRLRGVYRRYGIHEPAEPQAVARLTPRT